MLEKILREGIEEGVFDEDQVLRFPAALILFFQGIDFMMSKLGAEDIRALEQPRNRAIDYMVNGLMFNEP